MRSTRKVVSYKGMEHWQVDHALVCPGCNQRNVEVSTSNQSIVNPEFKRTRDPNIPKFIPSEVTHVQCGNKHCPLYKVTLEISQFFKLTDNQIADYGQSNMNLDAHDRFHNSYLKTFYKSSMQMPLFKSDAKRVATSDKCPVCGSTLYKLDDKSQKQDGPESMRECHNSKCKLHDVLLPLGRMKDISDKEIANFRNRQDRQDALESGKSPLEAYDETSSKTIPDGDKLDVLRNYRYQLVKSVVHYRFDDKK